MKLAEVQADRRILILGASGSGKTHLVGTLCRIMPTLVITADKNGLETLKGMGVNPEVVLVEDWRKIIDYEGEIARATARCQAVAIDDIGALQAMALEKIIYMPRTKGEEDAARGTPDKFQRIVKKELLLGERQLRFQSRDWPSLFTSLDTFLLDILRMPYAVKLVTALETVRDNPRDGADKIYPSLDGAIRTVLPAHFSLVAEAFIATLDGKMHYALTCQSHPRIETKSRYGQGRTWVDPDMLEVLGYINGQGEPESELEKRIGTGL